MKPSYYEYVPLGGSLLAFRDFRLELSLFFLADVVEVIHAHHLLAVAPHHLAEVEAVAAVLAEAVATGVLLIQPFCLYFTASPYYSRVSSDW